MAQARFEIRNTTKTRTPALPFEALKDAVLGKGYELSLVFCGEKLSRRLNRTYRDKDRPTNILSFPIDDAEGEIFICVPKLRSECKKFGRSVDNFAGFLFIHGLVHLNGMDHGSKMEAEEAKFRKRFGI